MDPNHKKLVIGGLIAGAIVLAYLFYVVVLHGSASVPATWMPDADLLPNKNVSSSDKTILVNARGYLYQYDVGFFPLDIQEIRNLADEKPTGNGKLIMSGASAQLTLGYSKGDNVTRDSTILVDLEILVATQDKNSYKRICDLKPTMDLTYKSEFYFSCPRRVVRTCFSGKVRVAELVLESFNVELGGDPKVIGRGEFSKPPTEDGCKRMG